MNVVCVSLCSGVKTACLCQFLKRKKKRWQLDRVLWCSYIEMCWTNIFLHLQTCPVCRKGGSGTGKNLCDVLGLVIVHNTQYGVLNGLNFCQWSKSFTNLQKPHVIYGYINAAIGRLAYAMYSGGKTSERMWFLLDDSASCILLICMQKGYICR